MKEIKLLGFITQISVSPEDVANMEAEQLISILWLNSCLVFNYMFMALAGVAFCWCLYSLYALRKELTKERA